MKNTKKNVESFATAKLQAKRRSLLTIIALAVVIGFTVIACSGGGGGGKLNGSFKLEGQEAVRTFTGNKFTYEMGGYKDEGTFTTSGDVLTLNSSDGDVTEWNYTLSGKTLNLKNVGYTQGTGQNWIKQ